MMTPDMGMIDYFVAKLSRGFLILFFSVPLSARRYACADAATLKYPRNTKTHSCHSKWFARRPVANTTHSPVALWQGGET
ncbi:hypothetical protein EDB19DRAFT_1707343 [Suillus lakei]|nr:hypothetical protein EDB19DRAFT_1707343 [Suillus lakei]